MRFRHWIAMLLVFVMTICISCAAQAQTVTGTAKGFGGDITVELTLDESRITAVNVVSHTETNGIGTNAIEQMPEEIVNAQSIAIDTVSGCTVTSSALLLAVENALVNAGLDVQNYQTAPAVLETAGVDEEAETDIVVVGGGLAGMTAVIKARELGAEVIILEKMSFTGGNTVLSTGAFFFGGTDIQAAAGVEDSADAFYEYIMEKSENKRDAMQARLVADKGNDAVNWMISAGVQISDKVSAVMGCPVYRAHTASEGASGMMNALTERAQALGCRLMLNTAATELITDEAGAVIGVKASSAQGGTLTVKAKKTILAAGGFAADPEKLEKYWGLNSIGYAGAPGTTGEMMEAALALGADTTDINEPWLTPTVAIENNVLVTSFVISKGAILVTSDGNRFCNEAASYAETSAAVFATGEEYVYEIFDTHVREALAKVDDYIKMGIVIEADTLEELAEKTGLPKDNLLASIDAYNAAVSGKEKDAYDREIFLNECNKGPFYCILVKPGTIMSPGGLKITEQFEVVRTEGNVIENLYAVGEMTGGYRAFGYVGGDSLSHCVVSGLIAAESAAAEIQ